MTWNERVVSRNEEKKETISPLILLTITRMKWEQGIIEKYHDSGVNEWIIYITGIHFESETKYKSSSNKWL